MLLKSIIFNGLCKIAFPGDNVQIIGNVSRFMLDLMQLAQDCAPEIPPTIIVAIAEKESSGNRFAIGHPNFPASKQPNNFGDAVRAADELAVAGQRYDLGLMQISSANFDWLGLDNVTALDPCKSMAAAQTVLLENIRLEGGKAESFFNSISRYNSGNKTTGYQNGYVTDIAVQLLNPPQGSKMSVKGEDALPSLPATESPPLAHRHTALSSWDEFGNTQDLFTLASSGKNKENGNIFDSREDEIARPDEAHRLQRVAHGD